MERKKYLDSLKGIATCGVVMVHTCTTAFDFPLGNLIAFGKYFVTLFFLISFYLLMDSYEKYCKQNGMKKGTIKKWLINKYLRFMPLYYIVLIINIFLGGKEYWYGSEGKVTFLNIIFHVFLINGLNPYYINSIIGGEWYLADLAIFILFTPIIYKLVNSVEKSIVFLIFAIIGATWLSNYALRYIPEYDVSIFSSYFTMLWFVAQLPVLAMGILIYHLLKLWRVRHQKILAGSLLIFSIYMIIGEMYGTNNVVGISNITLRAVWFSLMVIAMDIYSYKFIDNIIFQELGKKSYTIYLIQFLVINAYDKITGGGYRKHTESMVL